MVIDKEPPIELFVELSCTESDKKAAVLKDRLAYLLDTRFRPSSPEGPGLTVEKVAEMLECRRRTVLRLISRGKLHPYTGEHGELYFDRAEVSSIKSFPITAVLSKIVSRH